MSCGRNAASYVVLGDQQTAQKRYDDALLNYRKAVQKDPESGEAWYRLGSTLVKKQQFAEAFQCLSRAETLLPKQENVKVELANLLLSSYLGNRSRPQDLYSRIERLAGQLQALNPNSQDSLRLRGELALTDGKLDAAAELFQKANAIQPMVPEVVGPWVESLLKAGKFEQAEDLAQQLIAARKDSLLIYDVLYTHYMAEKRFAEGEALLNAKIANNPRDVNSLLQLGFHYNRLGKEAQMQAVLQRMLANPGSYPQGHLHAGEFYATLQRRDEAVREFREGAAADPKSRKIYLTRIASVQAAQGQTDLALQTLESILKNEPKDRDTRAARAILWLERGKADNLDAAVSELQLLVRETPDDPTLLYNLGRAQFAKGNFADARKPLLQVLKIRPDDVTSRLALSQISARTSSFPELLKYSNEILGIEPTNPQGRLWHAIALMNSGNYLQARLELSRFLKDYPESTDAQLQFGLLELSQQHYKEAESIFRKYLRSSSPDQRPLEGLLRVYAAQQQMDKALETAATEVKQSPASIQARSLLAAIANAANKPEVAIEQYLWMAKQDPRDFDSRIQLAQAYQHRGDLTNALTWFRQAQALAPKDGRVSAAIAFLLDVQGQRGEARTEYQKALRLDPKNPAILNNLAYLLADDRGDIEEALRLVQEARKQLPNDPGLADTLGWVYVQKHQNDGAIQIFDRLVREYPTDSRYSYHLGVAYLQSGAKEKARRQFQSALASMPDEDTTRKIKALMASIG